MAAGNWKRSSSNLSPANPVPLCCVLKCSNLQPERKITELPGCDSRKYRTHRRDTSTQSHQAESSTGNSYKWNTIERILKKAVGIWKINQECQIYLFLCHSLHVCAFFRSNKTLLMVHFRSRIACNTTLCKHSAEKPEDSQTQVEYMMSLDKYIRNQNTLWKHPQLNMVFPYSLFTTSKLRLKPPPLLPDSLLALNS